MNLSKLDHMGPPRPLDVLLEDRPFLIIMFEKNNLNPEIAHNV